MTLDLQSMLIPLQDAQIEDVASARTDDVLPVIFYTHCGGWVLGDKIMHDRLVREIANGVEATVIFVDYVNAPDAQYPTQQEQAYSSLLYVVEVSP